MRSARKFLALSAASLVAGGSAWATPHAGGIDFQAPATETARNVQAFHNEVLIIITVITISSSDSPLSRRDPARATADAPAVPA